MFFFATKAAAQKQFVEGEIVYKVNISTNSLNVKPTVLHGTMKLYLKGNAVLKQLQLEGGYTRTQLFKLQGASYTFINLGDKNFALQNDHLEFEKTLKQCSHYVLQNESPELKSIAQFKTFKAQLDCNHLNPFTIYYTKEWRINNPYLFETFSSFQYLPLEYTLQNADGSIIHATLERILSMPLDNSLFEIPKEYKIISREEYNAWHH